MESEESSSTSNGSKVFGSERRQKRSSPPLCEKADPDVRARETRAQQRISRRNARRPVVFIFMRSPPHWTRAAETKSGQQSAAATAPAATVLRGTKSNLPIRAEDFPMKAAARQRPIQGCRDSPRSG